MVVRTTAGRIVLQADVIGHEKFQIDGVIGQVEIHFREIPEAVVQGQVHADRFLACQESLAVDGPVAIPGIIVMGTELASYAGPKMVGVLMHGTVGCIMGDFDLQAEHIETVLAWIAVRVWSFLSG